MLASFSVSCGVQSVFQWVLSTLWVSGSVLGARATEMNKTHVYNHGFKEIRRLDGEMVNQSQDRLSTVGVALCEPCWEIREC